MRQVAQFSMDWLSTLTVTEPKNLTLNKSAMSNLATGRIAANWWQNLGISGWPFGSIIVL